VKVVKKVQCKLQTDTQQGTTLLETLNRFAAACNDVLHVAQENKTANKVRLQHLCYRAVKEKYGLQANLVIRAIARVAEAAKKRGHSQPRKFKPTSMSLDQRTLSFHEKRWEVSVSTVGGRLKIPLVIGNYQREMLAGQKPTSATLRYDKRTKGFTIHISTLPGVRVCLWEQPP
jgi:predicted transposase